MHSHTDIKREFRLEPKDKTAARGETVHFDCLPEAWPEPQITWRLNNQLIDLNEPLHSSSNNNNRLIMSLPDGSAKYAIERIAQADFVSIAGETPTSSSSLLLAGAQNEMDQGKRNQRQQQQLAVDKTASINDRVSPEAAAAAAQMFMSKDNNGGSKGSNATATNKRMLDLFGSRLVIKQADKMDEGKYSCLVETRGSHRLIEHESSSGQLTVLGECFSAASHHHVVVVVVIVV